VADTTILSRERSRRATATCSGLQLRRSDTLDGLSSGGNKTGDDHWYELSGRGGCRVEMRADVYVSTLRNFVGALGGELELVAKFPDGRVVISHLGDADDAAVVTEPVD
jgi:hypothetical protein